MLILYPCRSQFNIKHYIHRHFEHEERDAFTFLHGFKFVRNASGTVSNINRAWIEGFTCDWTVECCFLKFNSGGYAS